MLAHTLKTVQNFPVIEINPLPIRSDSMEIRCDNPTNSKENIS